MILQQFAVLLPLPHKGKKLKKIRPRVLCAKETNVGFQQQNKDLRVAAVHKLQHKSMQLNSSVSGEGSAEEHIY